MTNLHKQHQIDSLTKAIKENINRDPKIFCIGRPTKKWFASQASGLKSLKKRLRIVQKHKEPVYFTNDLKCEYVLMGV